MLPWKNTDLDIHAYYHENLNLGYAFLFSTKIWEENKTDLPLNFFTMLPYFYPHPKGPQFTPGPVLASLGKTLIGRPSTNILQGTESKKALHWSAEG